MRDEITTNNEKSKNYIDFYRLQIKLLLTKMLEVRIPTIGKKNDRTKASKLKLNTTYLKLKQ